ncbi:hypothetical protein AN214_03812 [Pseudoalteromonas sp. P1-9]|uniref:hypothetical protein n=1 Tax=Pseudoalteromonas sp. P1-9 TaxID=1710354 RepID=UPI0006D632ED|nr:hypothetical protein [Pseudoalteromonas sp. P1-9]KPV94179.1 hypothetical protein AN214_03812 [Pseudoalteromonas sp. P1-9]
MNESIVIFLWILGLLLCGLSAILLLVFKYPEISFARLIEENSVGKVYANLSQVVPERWAKPIFWLGHIGVAVFLINILYMLFSIYI